MEVGSYVWLPDKDDAYLAARLIESNKVELVNDKSVRTLFSDELAGLQPLDEQVLDPELSNLIKLNTLHEAAILHVLRQRFKRDEIYTAVSSILIAVNPFRALSLYGPETLEKYKKEARTGQLPPHIYSIADNAYRNMASTGSSQSIIIAGESGELALLMML